MKDGPRSVSNDTCDHRRINVFQHALAQCEIHEDAKLTASDAAAGDLFGASVSISGDVAFVGAYLDDCAGGQNCGSAYVYQFNGKSWVAQTKLTASDAAAYEYFGISLSVNGNVAVVGAALDICGDGRYCGSAYVYRYNGSTWVEEQKLTASDAANSDFFGYSVSISGDVVVVGAPEGFCGALSQCGSAYIYRFHSGVPGQWVEEQKLTALDPGQNDRFGNSVSVSGDVAVVGRPHHNCGPGSDCGSAFFYRFNAGAWVWEGQLTALPDDSLGSSVFVSGDTAVVGAPRDHCAASSTTCGTAYVYWFDGNTWVEQQKLTAFDAAAGDDFGYSVSVNGSLAVIGARADDCATTIDCGSAYIYRFNGTDWEHQAKLTASDGAERDYFGFSVSVSGDVAFVGAMHDDCEVGEDCGSAYVFAFTDCNANGVPDECENPLTLCDDGVPCTIDSCDEANQTCLHVPDAAVCDDGLYCNGLEICDTILGCQAGTPPTCNDGVACTVDACNAFSNACSNIPSDALCNDGLFCNGVESCDPQAGCVAGTPPCDETQICYEDKDDCFDNIIPTVSEWGLVILTLLLLTSAKVAFGRKGADRALDNQCSVAACPRR